MAEELELELTYLAKYLPEGLEDSPMTEMFDLYLPILSDHPKLRLRKNGNKLSLVKKNPISEDDLSAQIEQVILLSLNQPYPIFLPTFL